MGIKFNAYEIFEMAEQIERNGAKFYRKAAESAEGENRELLLRLAEMEDEHERAFAAMRAELPGAEKHAVTADPDDEDALYLQAMVKGKIFTADPSKNLTGSESMDEILQTAIDMEKDSVIFFYQSLKGAMSKVIGDRSLDVIIKEEIGHIVNLTQQLKAFKEKTARNGAN